jgi:hypothetical protein
MLPRFGEWRNHGLDAGQSRLLESPVLEAAGFWQCHTYPMGCQATRVAAVGHVTSARHFAFTLKS